MIQNDDVVRVWPHGSPDRWADGKVQIISKNQRSIAVVFDDKPPFVVDKSGGMLVSFAGLTMMATRSELRGKPWGPWIEMMGGGHFEIAKRPRK